MRTGGFLNVRLVTDSPNKPNTKLRYRAAHLINMTQFGGETQYTFDPDDMADNQFVAALVGDLGTVLAACTIKVQVKHIPIDASRSDEIHWYCVDKELRGRGLGLDFHNRLCEDARVRYPDCPQHHFVLDSYRHNWPFWVGKVGYILMPGDRPSNIASLIRRTF